MYRQLRQWNEIYITIHIWVTIRVSRSSIITDVIETQAASAIAELHLERRWGYAWRPVVGTLKSEWNSKTVSSVRVTLTLSLGTSVFKGALTQMIHDPSTSQLPYHSQVTHSIFGKSRSVTQSHACLIIFLRNPGQWDVFHSLSAVYTQINTQIIHSSLEARLRAHIL